MRRGELPSQRPNWKTWSLAKVKKYVDYIDSKGRLDQQLAIGTHSKHMLRVGRLSVLDASSQRSPFSNMVVTVSRYLLV